MFPQRRQRFPVALLLFFTFFCAGSLLLPHHSSFALGSKPELYTVGLRTLAADTSTEKLAFAVWYPSSLPLRVKYHVNVGGWKIKAERRAKPANKIFPVILVSHDLGRERFANHDLCSALAENGFVVIVPTHYGDSSDFAGAALSAALFYHRPRQLARAFDVVAHDPELGPILNRGRVGLLGVGTGAATVLQLAGVDILPENYLGYCTAPLHDQAFCSDWARMRLNSIPAEAAQIRAKYGKSAFVPPLPNIKALGLLTPGALFFLDKEGLSGLTAPLAVMFAGKDELFRPAYSGDELLEMFPRQLFDFMTSHVVDDADHYAFSAECSPELKAELPGICSVLSGDRLEDVHKERDNYFISFFKAGLGVPMPVQAEGR